MQITRIMITLDQITPVWPLLILTLTLLCQNLALTSAQGQTRFYWAGCSASSSLEKLRVHLPT